MQINVMSKATNTLIVIANGIFNFLLLYLYSGSFYEINNKVYDFFSMSLNKKLEIKGYCRPKFEKSKHKLLTNMIF